MKETREAIYFVAVLPPEEIRREINIFKTYASKYFQSSHALKAPAHITVFPPFKWSEDREEELGNVLEDLALTEKKFYVQINNFDCFAPSVIYLKIIDSPGINRIHRTVVSKLYTEFELENKSPHQFSPHITVAFRDLKRNFFMKAWSHFARTNYERAFQADRITLLKHEDGKWEILDELPLAD